nr:MAG TPA: Major capsid protein [Microviridae sp.]
MRRYKHSLSNYRLLTCDMGKLVPIGLTEALPGDTIQGSTSLLLRMSPQVAPVMHPISVRVHHWFVPNRMVFTGWEDFITGGKDGLGNGAIYPTNAAGITPAIGDVLDYMGVPTGTLFPAGALGLMPIRAYNKIYNEFYRDEDLITGPAEDSTVVQNIAWEKDYFTTARPWTQKGPAVTMPLGTTAEVRTNAADLITGTQPSLRLNNADGTAKPVAGSALGIAANTGNLYYGGAGPAFAKDTYPSNLYADLTTASAAQINDIRRAFALQRYQEARAQYGSRYTEYLRYLGIRSSDARLDRPEYLGGGKQTVAFSEVLRTGNEAADAVNPIGQLKGHGIAAMRSNRFRYFCEEHGYIITLLSIRPRTMYINGIQRTWSRRTKEDYFQQELERIGQQQIFNREVFAAGTAADALTFGYQDRYSEYRHQPSGVSG